jgi:UPF0716 family protein affecting phage T7 exclusion
VTTPIFGFLLFLPDFFCALQNELRRLSVLTPTLRKMRADQAKIGREMEGKEGTKEKRKEKNERRKRSKKRTSSLRSSVRSVRCL